MGSQMVIPALEWAHDRAVEICVSKTQKLQKSKFEVFLVFLKKKNFKKSKFRLTVTADKKLIRR